MNVEQIKNQAVIYARKFAEDETIEFDFTKDKYTSKEWYLVVTLAEIYYNLIKNIYTKEQASQKQAEAFKFAREHYGDEV